MPNLEKEEAIALFERRNRSGELVRDWSPEALADLIASINWNYQGALEVKDALQALYEQRRSEEAPRARASDQAPCGRCRGCRRPDSAALGGVRVGQLLSNI